MADKGSMSRGRSAGADRIRCGGDRDQARGARLNDPAHTHPPPPRHTITTNRFRAAPTWQPSVTWPMGQRAPSSPTPATPMPPPGRKVCATPSAWPPARSIPVQVTDTLVCSTGRIGDTSYRAPPGGRAAAGQAESRVRPPGRAGDHDHRHRPQECAVRLESAGRSRISAPSARARG